jgi:hypothetical protein
MKSIIINSEIHSYSIKILVNLISFESSCQTKPTQPLRDLDFLSLELSKVSERPSIMRSVGDP